MKMTTRHPLLTQLNEIIDRDTAPPGVKGRVAIGVRTGEVTDWWCVKLGAKAEAHFTNETPDQHDVLLLMDDGVATAIEKTGHLPEHYELLQLDGDRELVERFLVRYLQHTTPLQIRL